VLAGISFRSIGDFCFTEGAEEEENRSRLYTLEQAIGKAIRCNAGPGGRRTDLNFPETSPASKRKKGQSKEEISEPKVPPITVKRVGRGAEVLTGRKWRRFIGYGRRQASPVKRTSEDVLVWGGRRKILGVITPVQKSLRFDTC